MQRRIMHSKLVCLLAAVAVFVVLQIFTTYRYRTLEEQPHAEPVLVQEDATLAFSLTDLRHPPRPMKRIWPIIDGEIFAIQVERPGGISIVWKNLIVALSQQRGRPSDPQHPYHPTATYVSGSRLTNVYWDKIFYLDKVPESKMSKIIRSQPGVVGVDMVNGDRDLTIQQGIIDAMGLKKINGNATFTEEDPILVYFDTYYAFPNDVDVCKIMMYHDLIPEHVGLDFGPGTQFYPRIEQLDRVDSVVAVSYSTASDLLRLYPTQILRAPSSHNASSPVRFSETIVSVVQNRISSDIFPGAADAKAIIKFRKKYNIESVSDPLLKIDKVPYDYLLTVGAEHFYKNFDTVWQSLDKMNDEYLKKFTVLVVGRGDISSAEAANVRQRPFIITNSKNETKQMNENVDLNAVPLRAHVLSYLHEADLVTAYSASIGLIYLSWYEGFGLPLAEALVSGTLAVSSDTSSLPEVGGPSDITFYTKPKDVTMARDAIKKLLSMSVSERLARIKKGRKWAERFGGKSLDGKDRDLGWNDMARGIMWHISNSNKHRREVCYSPAFTLEK